LNLLTTVLLKAPAVLSGVIAAEFPKDQSAFRFTFFTDRFTLQMKKTLISLKTTFPLTKHNIPEDFED
jgi:hypothetical protein